MLLMSLRSYSKINMMLTIFDREVVISAVLLCSQDRLDLCSWLFFGKGFSSRDLVVGFVCYHDGSEDPKKKEIEGGSNELKLDIYDLLYLHPQDIGSQLISFKIKGTENYKVWSAVVQLALHTINKIGFINGKCVKEEMLIPCKISETCVMLLFCLGYWEDGSIIFNLHHKIYTLTLSGMSLSEYYHECNALWRQFDALIDLPGCSCAVVPKVKEHGQLLRLMQFLMGLDDMYSSMRGLILTTGPLPDVRSAFATLFRNESLWNSGSSSKFVKTGPSAFAARPSNGNNWNSNKNVLDIENGICLTQRKYYSEFLNEFGMVACKPCSTPIEVNPENKKIISKYRDDVPLTGITNYQKLVGKLIYLTMTRPDILYTVHCLSQVMHSLMQSHMRLVFRVLRYLKREPGLGITFKESDNNNLKVFVDSDWAKCKVTGRFITGYTVFLGNSLVSWKSKNKLWFQDPLLVLSIWPISNVCYDNGLWIKKVVA
ncbi:ribonuclease H-like domain-containing protein [Tanacetum coccineum]